MDNRDVIAYKLYGHEYDNLSHWGKEHVNRIARVDDYDPIKKESTEDHIAKLYSEIEDLKLKLSEIDDTLERLNEDYFNRGS